MKPRVNNPAWVRAIQDVIDALPSEPPDQINADPEHDRLPAVPRRHRLDAAPGGATSARTPRPTTARSSATSAASRSCPARTTSTTPRPAQWDKLPSGPNYAPNMAYLGWGVYVMARVDSDAKKQKAAWSAAAHLGGKDLSLWMRGLSVGLPALPQQPLQHPGMGGGRLRRGVHHLLSEVGGRLLQPSERRDRAAHPRHLPVLQRRRGRAGQDLRRPDRRRRQAPTPSPPPGRRSPTRSAATTRSSSTRPRSACSAASEFRLNRSGWWRSRRQPIFLTWSRRRIDEAAMSMANASPLTGRPALRGRHRTASRPARRSGRRGC